MYQYSGTSIDLEFNMLTLHPYTVSQGHIDVILITIDTSESVRVPPVKTVMAYMCQTESVANHGITLLEGLYCFSNGCNMPFTRIHKCVQQGTGRHAIKLVHVDQDDH